MPVPTVVILSSGGLRSLVATAATLSAGQSRRLVLLHLREQRPDAAERAEHVRRQAQHYRAAQVVELDVPQLARQDDQGQTTRRSAAFLAQLLLTGLAQAIELRAASLIWPAQYNAGFRRVSQATEQVVLVQHLAQLEQPPFGPSTQGRGQLPAVQTPLLELTDQQLVELGGHLGVPWHLAWSCLVHGPGPCRACEACRARRAAFRAAGMVDPVEQLTPVAR